GDAVVAEAARCILDPHLEHLGAGPPEHLALARYLQGDRRDGAGVCVAGGDQALGRAGEERTHPGGEVGARVQGDGQQLAVLGPRPADGLRAQLLLATREEVVDRPEGRVRGRDDLLHAGGLVTLAPHQRRAGIDDPLPRPGHPCLLRLLVPAPRWAVARYPPSLERSI